MRNDTWLAKMDSGFKVKITKKSKTSPDDKFHSEKRKGNLISSLPISELACVCLSAVTDHAWKRRRTWQVVFQHHAAQSVDEMHTHTHRQSHTSKPLSFCCQSPDGPSASALCTAWCRAGGAHWSPAHFSTQVGNVTALLIEDQILNSAPPVLVAQQPHVPSDRTV